MPNVSWRVPGTSGNWNSATNWTGLVGESFPGQVGSAGDIVTIGGTNGAYIVTFDVLSATIGSFTIEGGNGASQVTTLRMTAGDTLNIQGGVTLLKKGSPAAIDGAGTISATGGITAAGGTPNEGTITAGTGTTGGVLDLTGTGFITSPFVFAIGTAAPSTLEFNLAGGVVASAAITINNANQTLEVGPLGTLSIGATQNVTKGKILMAGGLLTDASGVSLGNGTSNGALSGFGTVAANLTRSGSGTADTITASGGNLDLTGTFGAGLVAAISAGSASTLKFDSIATSNAAISIASGNQTLEIGSAGELTIGADQNVTLGTIKLDGGILVDGSGISFGTTTSSGSLNGFGEVVASQLTRSGSGTADTITATGGKLTLFTTIGNNSGLVFNIGNSLASSLELDTAPGTGNTFTFLGSAGNLALPGFETDNVAVAGLNVGGSAIAPTNFIDILSTAVTVTSGQTGTGTSGTVTLSNGDTITLTGITNASAPWHVLTKSDGAGGTDVFLSSVCFAAGTHILTATGERAIESLLQGDIVLTLSDGELKARPIKWVGRRRIDLTAHPRPETVAPVRIQRGAIADNMPHTDLLLSPDHAIFVDGKLICARQLINGTTIRQEEGWTSIDYFHVELDAHAILLAEGLPTESYLDTGNRSFFSNSGEPLMLHPDLTDEADYPTREAGSCAPFAWDEASVQPVWQRLADRAAAIGWPVSQRVTTTDADLRVLADRRPVKPVSSDSDRVIFVLPRNAREVRLVSRAQSPTEARPWLEDRRRLGVRMKRIVLRGADELREVPVDHPDLTRGWWAVERDGPVMSRWTDGEAVLPLPAMSGNVMLEIHLAGTMSYFVDTMPEGRTERHAAA